MTKDLLDPSITELWPNGSDDTTAFDILNYSVPYFFGNFGILYDTTKITLEELETYGWDALNAYEKDVMFYDSTRDMSHGRFKKHYMVAMSISIIQQMLNFKLQKIGLLVKIEVQMSHMQQMKYLMQCLYLEIHNMRWH